jgi:tetratricopeptide (TPR) repeat protein
MTPSRIPRAMVRSLPIKVVPLTLALWLATLGGCSVASRHPKPNPDFLSQYNVRSGVRYPVQAAEVFHTVAGHLAVIEGGLAEAERYFDEVARLQAEKPGSDTPIELNLTRADISLQLGDLAGALEALNQIGLDNLSPEDNLLRAGLMLELGAVPEAAAAYEELLAAQVLDEPVMEDEATAFRAIAQRSFDPTFVPVCDRSSGPIAHLVCGRIAEADGRLEQAFTSFRAAQSAGPDLKSLQLDQYRVLIKLGRTNEVIEKLNKSFDRSQGGDVARVLKAIPSADFTGLQREIERLSPGRLSSADLRGKLAALELRASKPKLALRQISQVLAVEPTNDAARYLRASLLAAAGRRVEARDDLLVITPEQSAYGQARLLVAQLSRLNGDLERAQYDLRPYVDAFPGDRLAVLTYISLLKEQGKFSEALSLIAAIEAGNPRARGWLGLERAHVLKNLGRDEEAMQAAEEVLRLNPDSSPAQNFIAYELAVQGRDLDRARELAERAVSTHPDEPFYLDTLGWVMFRRGSLNKAEEVLERALELSDGDIVIAEHLGDVREAIELGTGQEVYRSALEKARDNEKTVSSYEEREARTRLESKVKN